jgi:PPOX class probable F420-dependent enzyme
MTTAAPAQPATARCLSLSWFIAASRQVEGERRRKEALLVATETELWALIASGREAVLATIKRSGLPQLSNVLYLPGNDGRAVRISTTADRLKAGNLARDPRAVLHVTGGSFWAYAVAEGQATLTAPATAPDDDACRELLEVHSSFYGPPEDEDTFFAEMIARRRLVIRLDLDRVYGVITSGGPRPVPRTG